MSGRIALHWFLLFFTVTLLLLAMVSAPRIATVTGTLSTTEIGVSLEGIQVFMDGKDLNGNAVQYVSVTDSTGHFTFTALPFGTWTLDAVKELNQWDTLTVIRENIVVSGDLNLGDIPLEKGA